MTTYTERQRKKKQKKRLFDTELKKKQRMAKVGLKKIQRTTEYKPSYDSRIEENKKYKSFTGQPDEESGIRPRVIIDSKLLDDYENREDKALQEKERKKKRVAIPFNKGAYQYLTDDQVESELKHLGKK